MKINSMSMPTFQDHINYKVPKSKLLSQKVCSDKRREINVEIISNNAADIGMLQYWLREINNIHIKGIHKKANSFLSGQTGCNVLFADIEILNKELVHEIKLRSRELNIIDIGSRQQFEKKDAHDFFFYFLQSPIIVGELLSVINLLKIYSFPVTYPIKKYLLVKSEYKIIK